MKQLIVVFFLGLLAVFTSSPSLAQVTNLNINHSGTTFTMTSGDTVRWEYDLPPGSTATGRLWYDVNANGVLDTASDFLVFAFTQTDGDMSGQSQGPPDLDFSANGHVVFYQRVGFPAGKYLFQFTQNGVGMTAVGTINALPSPAHTVSGHVTPPPGRKARNVLLQLERKEGSFEPIFWIGVTDSTGNFNIPMSADTAGNPWRLRPLNNKFAPAIVTPEQIDVVVTGNPSGNNFTYQPAAAQVAGFLRSEDGSPLIDNDVLLTRQGGMGFQAARSNQYGFFQVGLLFSDLSGMGPWYLQTASQADTTGDLLKASVQIPTINGSDSLVRNLTVFRANATIQGQVRVNGGLPHISMTVVASNPDSAEAISRIDSATGNFTLHVTTRIGSYQIFSGDVPPNYTTTPVTAHAGDTGVILNLTVTGIDRVGSNVPSSYSLGQNYPNPFNPSTNIEFEISKASNVRLAVYNLLGQEVVTLVNGELSPGRYKASFDGSHMPSGVYFYRLTAGSFTETRKMILAK